MVDIKPWYNCGTFKAFGNNSLAQREDLSFAVLQHTARYIAWTSCFADVDLREGSLHASWRRTEPGR